MSVVTSTIDVRHHRAERAGERPLRADHVVVQPADERAGLGAGEEGDGHALHVVEQRHAQVVDEALADARRPPALDERQTGVATAGGHDDQRGQQREQAAVAVGDGVSMIDGTAAAGPARSAASTTMISEEADEHPPVGPGEAEHPPHEARRHRRPLDLLGIGGEEHVRAVVHGPDRLRVDRNRSTALTGRSEQVRMRQRCRPAERRVP